MTTTAPQFTIGEAAKAANVPRRTVESLISRAVVKLAPFDTEADGHGRYRKLSRRTARKIAVVCELMALGFPPGRAAKVTGVFSDEGNPGRDAGEVFENGKTFLVANGNRVRVLNGNFASGLGEILHDPGIETPRSAIVVDVTRIVTRLDRELDVIAKSENTHEI